ncbi:MAG TPA: hypothetical protein VGO11_00300 [Chthoniobacteraceae bacterium]|jgi:hypothetical protein|nr:hypothetical protein [Chthoniobacteraceae bacterium]
MGFFESLGQLVTAAMRAAANFVENVTTPALRTSWDEVVPTLARDYFRNEANLHFSAAGLGYNKHDAWLLAEFSQLAYHEAADAQKYFQRFNAQGWKLETFAFPIEPKTQALIATFGDIAVLAFRGTRFEGFPSFEDLFKRGRLGLISWVDLMSDFSFFIKPHAPGGVHGGVLDSYLAWRNQFISPLTKVLAGAKRVFFAGHSLGGALAALAAQEFRSSVPVALLYTYGCPRFCNEAFRASYAGLPVYRLVHGQDFVSSVPPDRLPVPEGPFVHVGDILLLPRGKSKVEVGGHQPDVLEVIEDTVVNFPATVLVNVANFRFQDLTKPPSPRLLLGALSDHAPRFYSDGLRVEAQQP